MGGGGFFVTIDPRAVEVEQDDQGVHSEGNSCRQFEHPIDFERPHSNNSAKKHIYCGAMGKGWVYFIVLLLLPRWQSLASVDTYPLHSPFSSISSNRRSSCLSHDPSGRISLQSQPKLQILPVLETSRACYKIKYGEEWRDHCFPSLIVAGFPKCGSSYIFKMLSSHPHIIPTKRKELCLGGIMSETWDKFFQFLPNQTSSDNKIVMSGCLHLGANVKAMKELCLRELKVIYVLRDVADMLWSAYNFWCLLDHDQDCYPGKHTSKTASRSPEHFHQLVVDSQEMGGGIALTKSGTCYKKELKEAAQVFGDENLLVLRSETMLTTESDKERSLSRLQQFLFSSSTVQREEQDQEVQSWFTTQIQSRYRVNSGRSVDSRGEKNIAEVADREAAGLYEVSNFRPMLPETRQLIYRRWREECLWLKQTYNIHYESAC
jgi:hypothetical protein